MVPEMFWIHLIVGTEERKTMWPWRVSYGMAIDGNANRLFGIQDSIEVIQQRATLILKGNT